MGPVLEVLLIVTKITFTFRSPHEFGTEVIECERARAQIYSAGLYKKAEGINCIIAKSINKNSFVYYLSSTLKHDAMIVIRNLGFGYKQNIVFSDINTTLQAGHIYGILGRNGTGKSTLLYNIAGLLCPQAGTVSVMGFSPGKRETEFLQNIFMIPEEFHLPDIAIRKFVQYYSPFYPGFDPAAFNRYIETFNIPLESTLQSMSYGQKKKVLISFGIATNAAVLLMDEPTNGLDIISKGQLRKVIATAMDDKKCFLISSHQVKDLENLIDEVIIVNETKILLQERLDIIGQKLSFRVSFEASDADEALYSEPMLRGHAIVSENTEGVENKIDLELLYKATMAEPDKMKNILSKSKQPHGKSTDF